jgi:prophage tail gpP-like protein
MGPALKWRAVRKAAAEHLQVRQMPGGSMAQESERHVFRKKSGKPLTRTRGTLVLSRRVETQRAPGAQVCTGRFSLSRDPK